MVVTTVCETLQVMKVLFNTTNVSVSLLASKRVMQMCVALCCYNGCALAAPLQAMAHASVLSTIESADEILITSEDSMATVMDHELGLTPRNVYPKKSMPLRYQIEIQTVAQQLAMDPALLHAVIQVESGYQAKRISPKGAIGLMQLMPSTAKVYSVTPVSQMRPIEQIEVGARYLKSLLHQFDDELSLALAAYNAGPQAVLNHHRQIPPYHETQRYVPLVLHHYRQLQAKTPATTHLTE